MTTTTRLPGVGADDITLSDGRRLADIDDLFGPVTWDFGVGKVAEFTVPTVDVGGRLSRRRLLREGVTLRFDSQPWMIAAVDRDYRGDDIWLGWTARSRLARRLRNMTGPDSTRGVTPGGWIVPRVKKAGGVAIVEPGAKRRHIVQKRNQSVLAVIEALASDTGVEWVEFDGQVFVGTAWWAFQGGTGLPTWDAPIVGDPAVLASRTLFPAGLQTRSSQDDRGQAATATMTVEPRDGIKVRPWHRINVTGADPDDNGLWLVTNNSFDNKGPQASLSLQRPLKSHPKKGSQGNGGQAGGGDPSALDGDWIDNADKAYPGCTRTPRQYVAYARSQKGHGFRESGCLAWVSIALRGREGLGGYSARYVWKFAPASAVKSPGDTSPPIGALVVWGAGAGQGNGHIGISTGGGQFISATGGAVVERPIAGFTGDYLGAMTPHCNGSYPQYPGA